MPLVRFYLIPICDALSAIQAHFPRYPDNTVPPDQRQLRELVDLVARFVPVSQALLEYADTLGGKPSRN